jgi:hypothetical protein
MAVRSKLAQTIIILTYILEVPSSILKRDTGNPDCILSWLSLVLSDKFQDISMKYATTTSFHHRKILRCRVWASDSVFKETISKMDEDVSFTPRPLYSWEIVPGTHWIREWLSTTASQWRENKSLVVHPYPGHRTDWYVMSLMNADICSFPQTMRTPV